MVGMTPHPAGYAASQEGDIESPESTLPMDRRKNLPAANGTLLDGVNRRLLAELQADARLSLAELGRRVGLTAPAVGERLTRLEEAGVIRGYHADVDPRALGYDLGAILRIRPDGRQLKAVAEVARRTPEVVACHRITGDDCYLMQLYVRDVDDLERVIDRFTPYGQTTTSIMQSSPVTRRALPLEDGT
jgi:Lrp/AsnC family leucine-responsive transcriptional regulator